MKSALAAVLPTGNRLGIDWDRQPLGKVLDSVLANRLGVTVPVVTRARMRRGIEKAKDTQRTVGHRRGIVWDRQPLGKVPDRELALRLGVHHTCVAKMRAARGIAPFGQLGVRSRVLIDWDNQPYGQIPDQQLAARLRCEESWVRLQRHRRGIPKYDFGPMPVWTDEDREADRREEIDELNWCSLTYRMNCQL